MSNLQLHLENTDRVDDLVFSPLEQKYLKVQYVATVLIYLALMMLVACILFIEGFTYRYVTTVCGECILFGLFMFNLAILPKAYRFKGYAIREHDITYRSGILFPSVITVPFCKIQQVSVRQNPITRMFGLYAVDLVNGAQRLDAVSIPGLTAEEAHRIKTLVIERRQNESK